jgi:hypothetical protein
MGPEQYVPQQQVRDDLVNMLDLSATTLAWAGIEQPSWYSGQDLFAADFKPRIFLAAQKDRLDHTIDRVRTIRTDRFRYVRNYKLDRIFLQPQYRDKQNYTQNLHQLYREGKLSARHREIYFGERPAEEFYDVSIDPHMMIDLAGNLDFADELDRHRAIMDEWLAVGDLGEGDEPIAVLKANGEGTKWGEGVNVEYEAYRDDSDGDGLSDKWETLNGRDAQDGRLYFDFDCGGWQTEGWFSEDISANLAGSLGTLDFELDGVSGSIRREELNLVVSEADKALTLDVRSSGDLKCIISVNGQAVGHVRIDGTDTFQTTSLDMTSSGWGDVIQSLELAFEGDSGTVIEIDAIQIYR